MKQTGCDVHMRNADLGYSLWARWTMMSDSAGLTVALHRAKECRFVHAGDAVKLILHLPPTMAERFEALTGQDRIDDVYDGPVNDVDARVVDRQLALS